MKKILLVLLTVLLLTGCGKKVEEQGNNIQEPKLAEDEIVLENIKYKFDQDANYNGINYKVASNLRVRDSGNAMNYFSEEIDGSSYFVFRIFYYKNKDINYAIKDTTDNNYLEKKEVTIDDKTYTVVRFKNPIGDEIYTDMLYYRNKKDTYAYCFTAKIDLTELEELFLKNVVYPE